MTESLLRLQEILYTSKNPTRRYLHCARRDWISRSIQAAGQLKTALEVGPGAGVYLPILKKQAEQVTASDIEPRYLDYVKEKWSHLAGLVYVIDDISHSSQAAHSFKLILCTEVIEHIADSQAALHSLKKLLADQGRLILSTPQRYSPLELTAKIAFLPGIIQIVRKIYDEEIIEAGHINLLTEKQLKQQLKNAGFLIETQYKCGLYIPFLAEFTGNFGLKLERYLEDKIRGTRFDFLLWTQCYVLRAKK
ncbi:class I SAM-dependent methyltransferase [Candidatus Venteria ishoeyi]|uniref:class I SAM-dependent methyltransferase n=1 Tax=Candidatus Venteria ishoeyi TaxID=1899563 RepID=UPI0025A53938|nr:class I SAM-dependent methyltransferase [Candidatus Venteria ishoeyi]MDM8547133.1 class I SAM-dependent methyltransferase [Candidatus Venteria ishoeyi]